MTAAIVAKGLCKRFGNLPVLRDVSLTVPAGVTYGLLGPSGSGKSTLIRLLLGLGHPDAGEVTVLGRRMPDREMLARVGYLPQSTALYQDLTARENVAFFARVHGIHDSGPVEAVLELVQLRSRAGTPIHTFSGGMLQRTSLACALVHRPLVLFLDEPTIGLDPLLRAAFWQHFRHLNSEGVTIILTTHMMEEAQHADLLGLLRGGAMLAEGSPADVCRAAAAADLQGAFLKLAEAQGE